MHIAYGFLLSATTIYLRPLCINFKMEWNYLIIGILMILAGSLYLFYRIKTYQPNRDNDRAMDLRLDFAAISFIIIGGLSILLKYNFEE